MLTVYLYNTRAGVRVRVGECEFSDPLTGDGGRGTGGTGVEGGTVVIAGGCIDAGACES